MADTELKISEVFDLAADEIERRGWAVGVLLPEDPEQHVYESRQPWGDDGGNVCLEGALAAVLEVDYGHPEFRNCKAYSAMREYLELLPYQPLFSWNDVAGRRPHHVVEALRGAAAVERVKEAAQIKEEVFA